MLTIGQAAKELKIPKSTVRGWVGYYNDFLSDNAKPPKGQVKRLDNDDMAVLWSVHFWRSEHKSKAEIYDLLGTGERLVPGGPQTSQEAPESNESTEDIADTITSAITLYQGKIDDLTNRLIEAEIRAAKAEKELEVLKELTEKETPQSENLSFWQRVFGRGK